MKRDRFAVAFIALVAFTIILTPFMRGEVFSFRDHSDYFQPLRFFTAMELREGRLPLWNPYSASGERWLANPQTGVFYPPSWLHVLLPFSQAYMLYLALHLAILGLGAYALFARDSPPGAALTGAVALMLCGPTLSLLDVSNNLAAFAWLPWVLWSARARSPLASLFLPLSFLAGEPFFAGLGALLYVLVVRDWREILRRGVTAAGLSAVQLLPFLELLRGSDRSAGLNASEILRDSMGWRDWLRMAVWPGIHPDGFDPMLGEHFIPIVYTGLSVILLALAALIGTRTPEERRRIAGWLGLLAFAIAIGSGPRFLTILPLTLFRYPARLVPIAALALAALAVIGWSRIRPGKRWADLLLIIVMVVDAGPVITPLLMSRPFNPHVIRYPPAVGQTGKIVRLNEGGKETLARDRIAWIAGYYNLLERRFDSWTAAPVISQQYVAYFDSAIVSADRQRVAALAARWFLSAAPLPASVFIPYRRMGRVTLYEYRPAAAMARLQTDDGTVTPASNLRFSTSSVEFETRGARPGVAVVSQQQAAGWQVFVDGVRGAAIAGETVFRAVKVPAGIHHVAWRYRPATLIAGSVVTIATMITQLAVVLFVKRRKYKKFSSPTR